MKSWGKIGSELTAIATQHRLTYGLNRSPTLAARQNVLKGLFNTISHCSIWSETGRYSPSLVAVKPCRKDAVKICAGADEQQNHKEERLKLEDSEHGGGRVCVVPKL
jgi:hypothetical protein